MVREKLMKFCDRSARFAFEWGQHDCLLDVADWLDIACGFDVARNWRGAYSTEAECKALLEAKGGIVAAIKDEAARLGLKETIDAKPGDVALVALPEPMGAIMMPSKRWRMRTLDGFAVSSLAEVIVAWSVPCRP